MIIIMIALFSLTEIMKVEVVGLLDRLIVIDVVIISPRLILLTGSPGGNDALNGMSYDNAIDNIKSIINKLQNKNPNVTHVEKMAPAKSFFVLIHCPTQWQLHVDIETIALENSTTTSQVITS